jgi:hypothetical protein
MDVGPIGLDFQIGFFQSMGAQPMGLPRLPDTSLIR